MSALIIIIIGIVVIGSILLYPRLFSASAKNDYDERNKNKYKYR